MARASKLLKLLTSVGRVGQDCGTELWNDDIAKAAFGKEISVAHTRRSRP